MSASVAIIKRPRSMRRREIMVGGKEKKGKCTWSPGKFDPGFDWLGRHHVNRLKPIGRPRKERFQRNCGGNFGVLNSGLGLGGLHVGAGDN